MSCDACTSAVCICWDEPPAKECDCAERIPDHDNLACGCLCECHFPPEPPPEERAGKVAWYGVYAYVYDLSALGVGGWPAMERCPECQAMYLMGEKCPKCPPANMVRCPYGLGGDHDKKCAACKGAGWVEELT